MDVTFMNMGDFLIGKYACEIDGDSQILLVKHQTLRYGSDEPQFIVKAQDTGELFPMAETTLVEGFCYFETLDGAKAYLDAHGVK